MAQEAQTGAGREGQSIRMAAAPQLCLSEMNHQPADLVVSVAARSQLHPILILSRRVYALGPHGSKRRVGARASLSPGSSLEERDLGPCPRPPGSESAF